MDGIGVKSGKILYIKELMPPPTAASASAASPQPLVESGSSVRVFGKLTSYDTASNVCTIEHEKCALRVLTHLLDHFVYKIGSMFQFIGELDTPASAATSALTSSQTPSGGAAAAAMDTAADTKHSASASTKSGASTAAAASSSGVRRCEWVLVARVVRNIDGLDIPLFEQSLQLRRKFEKSLGL